MKLLIFAAIFVAGVLSVSVPTDPLSNEFIDYINSFNTTWKAGRNFKSDISRKYLLKLNGVRKGANAIKLPKRNVSLNLKLPKEFDCRDQWPECETISEIRDQGSCSSCWAFAAVETMSDRICIHSSGKEKVRVSAVNLLSCCKECGFGCDGGFPGEAWSYWERTGIVSGGKYGSNEGCQPYSIAPCEHFTKGSKPQCSEEGGKTPECKETCQNSSAISYHKDLHYGKSTYSIGNNIKAIQTEINKHGPVEAVFTVHEDFFNYKEGVYQHVAGGKLADHAVKIIGWGVEYNTPYWLAANSWNTDWGNDGFFKILRGENECGIEEQISTGIPRF